jgi:hypothetical protein
MEIQFKTTKELESLNTKRLLSYYKTYRNKFKFHEYVLCEEFDGDFPWNYLDDVDTMKDKAVYFTIDKYLKKIKEMLNKRENI